MLLDRIWGDVVVEQAGAGVQGSGLGGVDEQPLDAVGGSVGDPGIRGRITCGERVGERFIVGGLFLVQQLHAASLLQDCLMSGRRNCGVLVSTSPPRQPVRRAAEGRPYDREPDNWQPQEPAGKSRRSLPT